MATTRPNSEITPADEEQEVRRRAASVCRSLMAVDGNGNQIHKFGGFVKHNDLQGTWTKADPSKAYMGVVPIIDGKERFDISQLYGEMVAEMLSAYDIEKKAATFVTPEDDYHKFVRKTLDMPEAIKLGQLCDKLVEEFPAGAQFDCCNYLALKMNGGFWANCLFGLKK